MRERPRMPASTPDTRPERVEVPVRGIRVKLSTISGAKTIHGWVTLFSITGMFVQTDVPLPDDTEISIDFTARVGTRAHRLQLLGWVVQYHTHGMGVQFDQKLVKANPVLGELVAEYTKSATPEQV